MAGPSRLLTLSRAVARSGTAPLRGGGTTQEPWSRRRTLAIGVAATFLWAAGCNALLDVAQGTNGVDSGFGFLSREQPLVFLLSALLTWLLLLAVLAVTGRVVVSCALVAVVAALVAFANHEKIVLRGEPIYPADLIFLTEPNFLLEMTGIGVLVGLVVGALVLVLAVRRLSSWVGTRAARLRHPRGARGWYLEVAARVGLLLVLALVLSDLRAFHHPGNPVRRTYEALGAEWTPWSQHENYIRHGVVAGLLYNLDVTAMDPPPGYDRARMVLLEAEYSAMAQQINRGRDASALEDTNVVVVLSEAFTDPTRIPGIELAEDPIPFTRELMGRTPSGSMLSPLIGGGTANVEFEALTGQSLSQFSPQMTTPYQMLVAKQSSYPSAVSYFEEIGHRTLAVHPYRASMYQRDRVYPVLGFDETVFEGDLAEEEKLDDSKYVDDASAFDEVLDHLAKEDAPEFVQLVTMQNHYPMAGSYADPIAATGVDGSTRQQLEHYARGLRYSDEALEDFLAGLQQLDEDTAVVFYGDHTPAFWADSSQAGELGSRADVLHETPYFLWSSDDRLDGEEAAKVTSPAYFLPMLLDELGAPLPPLYALLLRLQRALPALLPGGDYRKPGGERVAEEDLDGPTLELLRDLRLVQYDLSVGEGYASDMLSSTSRP